LAMICSHQRSVCKKYEYLYYECKGHQPLSVGRTTSCKSKRARADRLDEVAWQSLSQLLCKPEVIPQLHQAWAEAKQQSISSLEAQQLQLLQRKQRIERQDQRLLDAYQIEAINLAELQARRQKFAAELQQIEQESLKLANARQQTIHWRQVIDNAQTFRQLLGDNFERLSFEERQTVAQCLIAKVIVMGEDVDIHFVLPFESTPQAINRQSKEPEGAPGHFYRLRLAHLDAPSFFILLVRPLAKFGRDQNQALAVLQAATAQVEFHAPHLAGFRDDQRAIDARPAKQPPGMRILSPPVADQRVLV
jgi:hypothetical protein